MPQLQTYNSPQKQEIRQASCEFVKNGKSLVHKRIDNMTVLFLPAKDAYELPILESLGFTRKNMFMVNHNVQYLSVMSEEKKHGIPESQRLGMSIHDAIDKFEKDKHVLHSAILDFMFPILPNSLNVLRHIGSSLVWHENASISLTIMNQRENGCGINEDLKDIAEKFFNGDLSLARAHLAVQAFCCGYNRGYNIVNRSIYQGDNLVQMQTIHFTINLEPKFTTLVLSLNNCILVTTARKSDITRSLGSTKWRKRRNKFKLKKLVKAVKEKKPVLVRVAKEYREKRVYVKSANFANTSKAVSSLWTQRRAWVKLHPEFKGKVSALSYEDMNGS